MAQFVGARTQTIDCCFRCEGHAIAMESILSQAHSCCSIYCYCNTHQHIHLLPTGLAHIMFNITKTAKHTVCDIRLRMRNIPFSESTVSSQPPLLFKQHILCVLFCYPVSVFNTHTHTHYLLLARALSANAWQAELATPVSSSRTHVSCLCTNYLPLLQLCTNRTRREVRARTLSQITNCVR